MIDTPKTAIRYISMPRRAHGAGVRGENLDRQSIQSGGRFGYMFSKEKEVCPAAVHSPCDLEQLARAMTAKIEQHPTPEEKRDDEENSGISAGYTYLGQFIDHDLTFDPASSLDRQNDPDALVNFRTSRFDLDCLYGRGPSDQPYLYANDGIHMLLGRALTGSEHDPNVRDLPRNTPNPNEPQRALIGDPRNDENVIVSQLHATMLRFHNRLADLLAQSGQPHAFEDVQREVRFHYQWVVLHDFLPTIIGADMVHAILPQLADDSVRDGAKSFTPHLQFFKWEEKPFIPVEFSVAAYRFGHSMIRPIYRLNTTLPERLAIFAPDPTESLLGFRAFREDRAIDWNLFFKIDKNPPELGYNRLQPAYKIDTSLVNPLGSLPNIIAQGPSMLAVRNLQRGLRMGLPSGQAVAHAMKLPVIPDAQLRVGKATEEDHGSNCLLTEISPNFAGNAPLWYYILAEAQQAFIRNTTPIRLGPVGGRIVGEVFVGLMFGDSQSYVRQNPSWRPHTDLMPKGRFGMAELIGAARA